MLAKLFNCFPLAQMNKNVIISSYLLLIIYYILLQKLSQEGYFSMLIPVW